jgi:GNAT superfamily N-acetyltransferase
MSIEVVRVSASTSEAAFSLIEEYYEAVDVLVRDDRGVLQSYAADADGGIWLAYFDGQPAGCIVLRTQSKLDAAGEVKRLYVRPAYRGQGVALRLLTELERFAVARGFQWLYLDSKDDLRNAIVFYRRCGYETCERYNDNPQATVFLRKALAGVRPSFQK